MPKLLPIAPAILESPSASTPPATTPIPALHLLDSDALFLPNPAASAHSVSLVELADGRIGAAWFSGSKEGARDVRIVFATYDGRQWTDAMPVMERAQAQHDTVRLVRKIGNPVLWHDTKNGLHLWFVSVGYGGWGGSALNHTQSSDGGVTWSAAERLITSPFLNISTLVRGTPLSLTDGGLTLPVYHEFVSKHPEWLRLDARGQIVDKLRFPDARSTLQPSAAIVDGQQVLALLRDAGNTHRIQASRSDDGGNHWSSTASTSLANPNAGIALLRLADGRLLLASNPQESNRNRLALQISGDGGATWSAPQMIEEGGNDDEYSYPALLQDRAGTIHLAYTWKREKICHRRFQLQSPEGSAS